MNKQNISIKKKTMIFMVMVGLMSCGPMEDSSWVNNETLTVNWEEVHPQTGEIPDNHEVLIGHFYGTNGNYKRMEIYPRQDIILEEDTYNALAIKDKEYTQFFNKFEEASIIYPTSINESGERLIENEPKEMIYFGKLNHMDVKDNIRSAHTFNMRRALKKITFMVSITDKDELGKDCEIDISGLGTRFRMAKEAIDKEEEASMRFLIHKNGRPVTLGTKKQTFYKGSRLILGTAGRNIVKITYTDAKGQKKRVDYDVTHALRRWKSYEIGAKIHIDSFSGKIKEWEWVENFTNIDMDL